jgi:predicted hotdog family 3-hydroxylacyl-ACP dehydratase
MEIEKEELAGILPHRGRMLLLSRIKEYDTENRSLKAEYDIDKACLFYDPAIEGVPAWAGFEFMAQAISALSGITGRLKGEKPKLGFILSVSAMKVYLPVLKTGNTVSIEVWEDYRVDMVYTFHGRIMAGSEIVAEAKLTVMDVDDTSLELFIKGTRQN